MGIKWLSVFTFLLVTVSNSTATLIIDDPFLGGVVQIGDQYWIQDFRKFANLSYGGQLAAIDVMNVSISSTNKPWGDWRMAKMNDVRRVFVDDYFYNFFDPSYAQIDRSHQEFIDYNVYYYARIDDWSEVWGQADRHSVSAINLNYLEYTDGTRFSLDPWNHGLDSEWDNPGDDAAESWLGAWVVADHLNNVSEPSSLLLFGVGMLGITGIVLRKKRRVKNL